MASQRGSHGHPLARTSATRTIQIVNRELLWWVQNPFATLHSAVLFSTNAPFLTKSIRPNAPRPSPRRPFPRTRTTVMTSPLPRNYPLRTRTPQFQTTPPTMTNLLVRSWLKKRSISRKMPKRRPKPFVQRKPRPRRLPQRGP